jgi:hypothetical protein
MTTEQTPPTTEQTPPNSVPLDDDDWVDALDDALTAALRALGSAEELLGPVAELGGAGGAADVACGYIREAIRRARHEVTGAANSAWLIQLLFPKNQSSAERQEVPT